MNPLLSRIGIDPNVCHGQPCIKGTRILVSLVVDSLANGDFADAILAAYPKLSPEDIRACLSYATEMTRERVLPIKVD